jgi:O-antigen ligase
MNRHRLSMAARVLARLALGAMIVALPLRYLFVLAARPVPPVYGDYTDILLFWSDVFLLGTLGLWLLSLALQPRRLSFGPRFLRWPLAALIVLSGVTAFFSIDPLLSFHHFVHLLLLAGLALYVVNEIESVGQVMVPVALMIATQSIVGIAQVLFQRSVGLSVLGEWTLDPQVKGISVVFAGDQRFLRAYGLTDHPNLLGGCLAFALVLILAWPGSTASRRARWGGVFALGALALYLTFSRAAWLALGAGALVSAALYVYNRQPRIVLEWLNLAGAALLILAPFVWWTAPYLGGRLDTQSTLVNQAPVSERAYLNDAAMQILRQHPLTGVGVGALPLALRAAFPNFPLNYQPAHFALLDAAAETGLPGAAAYLIALIAPWAALGLRGAWRRAPGRTLSPALIAASGALVAVTLVGFFDYYTWLLAPGRLWQWLIWGLWAGSYEAAQRST